MDPEAIDQIRMRAQEAVEDLSATGAIGVATITATARALELIAGLNPLTADASRVELGQLASELRGLLASLPQYPGALDAAARRAELVARVASEGLAKGGSA